MQPVSCGYQESRACLKKKFLTKIEVWRQKTGVYKDDSTKVKNYRPVNVLPTVSKIFERLMQKKLSEYINQFLSPFLYGYSKDLVLKVF